MKTLDQLDPNYVIAFDYSKDNLAQLLAELSIRGLEAVTHVGSEANTVLVFTRVDVDRAKNDDLYAISQNLPFITSQSPIYDQKTSKRLDRLLQRLTKKEVIGLPTEKELVELALLTGNPEQSLYFAYLKYYIHWLMPLSIIGLIVRILFGRRVPWEFNKLYTVCLFIWSMSFTATWIYKRKKHYIGILGGVHKATLFEPRNGTVNYDKHFKVIMKKCCFIPIALLFVAVLVSFQLLCFGIEILVTQLYSGPFVNVLSLIPTILIGSFTPILTMFYNSMFVNKFVKWENGSNPKKSIMEKNFVLTFFISYMPLIITLFLYLPFGYKVPNKAGPNISSITDKFHIPLKKDDFIVNVERYRAQILYFTVTNQVIAIFMENILPLALHILNVKRNGKDKSDSDYSRLRNHVQTNRKEDLKYWDYANFLQNNEWGKFNFDDCMKKLVIQFGYIAMFSVIWPLAPLVFLLFNIIMLKLDLWRSIDKCTPVSFPNNTESSEARDEFSGEDSLTDSWNVITEFILLISLVVAPTLTMMYSNCKLPGIGRTNSLEKRDLWYTYYPFEYNWYTILAFGVFMEHFAAFVYFVLCKVLITAQETPKIGHIPVNALELPNKTNLLDVSLETNKYMSDIEIYLEKEKEKARRTRKQSMSLNKEAGVEKVKDIFEFTDKTPHESPKPSRSKPFDRDEMEVEEKIHSSPKFSKVINEPRIISTTTIKRRVVNNVGKSNTAGATLPDNIPTSKNYNLRTGRQRSGSITDPLTKVSYTLHGSNNPDGKDLMEKDIDEIMDERLKSPVNVSPKQKAFVRSLDNKELATKAAATVVKADRDEVPITPLRVPNESKEQKENEIVVPLSNIGNIRRSLSLRRKSVVSEKSNKSNKSNNANLENEPEASSKNTPARRPSIKNIVNKIKQKM
ncbi:increased sodium tolerance protein 2 [Monosporozyma servazzii]